MPRVAPHGPGHGFRRQGKYVGLAVEWDAEPPYSTVSSMSCSAAVWLPAAEMFPRAEMP